MKMNWGTGIAMLYVGFMIGILTLVVMSTRQKIDLVTTNYYEEELRFQGKMDKMARAKALADPIRWEVKPEGVLVQFPTATDATAPSGTISLYCPSDERKDVSFPIVVNPAGQQLLPAGSIQSGRYTLQIDWQQGTETYWSEGVLRISE
jgi:hypothetical protein